MKQRAITFAFAACLFISLAFAEDTWTIDSSTSNARLYQGSKANPDSVNTGVARVTGKVKLDTNDPEESIFDLSIYAAFGEPAHVLVKHEKFVFIVLPSAGLCFHVPPVEQTRSKFPKAVADSTGVTHLVLMVPCRPATFLMRLIRLC